MRPAPKSTAAVMCPHKRCGVPDRALPSFPTGLKLSKLASLGEQEAPGVKLFLGSCAVTFGRLVVA